MSASPLAQALCKLLADSYTLYLKTQNFHWNVRGPRFRELHLLFQEQYEELIPAIDLIAERIRTLGFAAPGSFAAFSKLKSITEAPDAPPSAEQMVKALTDDQSKILVTANAVLKAAQKESDDVTADLALGRISLHEKNRWMLESLSEKQDSTLTEVA